jgi:hypothetical protein
MYEKCTKDDILVTHREGIFEFRIDKTELLCGTNGVLYRQMKTGHWKLITNKSNHNKGYNVVLVNKKQYTRAKLILYAQNKISLDAKNVNIYHRNGNRLDCAMDNLTMDIQELSEF